MYKPNQTNGSFQTSESLSQPTTNNLEGWRNNLVKALTPFIYTKHNKIYFGLEKQELRYEGVLLTIEQFISDLRKKDMEELIKRINLQWRIEPIAKAIKLIKDYYKNL
jgi:hypothetical protein